MKIRFIAFLVICCLVFSVQAQDMAISFHDGSWAEILAEAKADDKIIFVDAYTDWCGPCKMMDKNTFTDTKVGEVYNERFINVKLDMEKGEGPAFAEKYGVRAYPSFVFVNGDGEMVHRGLGYQPADQFLDLADAAIDDDRSIGGMQRRYAAGDRQPDLLKNYAYALGTMRDPQTAAVADAYMATQEDWSTPENREFILNFATTTDSKLFEYLATNRASFEEEFGKTHVISRMQNIIFQELVYGTKSKTRPGLEDIEALVEKAYPELAPVMMARFKMTYYQRARDMENYQAAAIDYVDNYNPDSASELNSVAWAFYETVDDPAMLKKALKWAKRSVELEKGYFNTDTLAALYFKTGQEEKGLRTAKEAIELAKADGMDYAGTEELIEKYSN